ncbi:MAG: hypothetical protein HY674_08895 [Chloroflexi bacterium]|nr:hypothetical protein [Chloroflexota bacterium]
MVRLRVPRLQCAPSVISQLSIRTLLALLLWALPLTVRAEDYAGKIAPLIDPAKLSTLGQRGANPRVQKCVYWLEIARRDGEEPAKVIDTALRSLRIPKEPAKLTKHALLRNLTIAERLGCLDAAGLEEMKHGKAPTIGRGPYDGDQLSVDHIIPRVVCPELDNVIANLELMPARMNSAKRDAVGDRQIALARRLHQAGLLSDTGLKKALKAAQRPRRRVHNSTSLRTFLEQEPPVKYLR